MSDFASIDYFLDPSLVDDPFPYFEYLREQGPVVRLPHHDVVAVTGYEEAASVWRDPETFSSCIAVTGPFPGLPPRAEGANLHDHIEANRAALPMGEYMITQDPPLHTAMRGLLMKLLTPNRLKDNEAFMWRLAKEQVDEILASESVEVLQDFGQPFALLVIADLLGVPAEDHQRFKAQLGLEKPEPTIGGDPREVSTDPLAFLAETFGAYVEDRRQAPREDVLTQLARATYPDGALPDVIDVVRLATFLFAAGQDTTARLMTAALKVIGDDREIQHELRAAPEAIPNFLEEVLRLEGPVKTVSRVARRDTTLAGVEIPAGTTIAVFPHAANRDPSRFESPNEFRLTRRNAREHLAFGRGVHTCPGGTLARVEAKIALERLLARTSDIQISEAVHGPRDARRYEYEPTYILRGVKSLHIDFTQADPRP